MIETVPLGEVARVFNGKTPSKAEKRSVGHPVLKIKDVDDRGVFCGEFDSFVDDSFAQRYRHKAVQTNDVLILNAAHNSDYVGSKMLQAPPEVQGSIATGEWLMVRSASAKLDQGYMWHWFQSPPTRDQIRGKVKGIHLYPRDVAELLIPVPAPDEQRRIAAILDKAVAIRRKRERALALADDFLKSVFLDMFGDPLDNPYGFSRERIGEHLSKTRAGTQSGPFGSALKKHEYTDYGVPVWGVENVHPNQFRGEARLFISNEKYEDLRRYNVVRGDVLISRAGTVGRMCVAEPVCAHSIISTNLVRVSLDQSRLLPEYFVCLFTYFADRLGALKANNKDDAFTFLNPKTLREIKIPIPKIARQRNFVGLTCKLDGLLAKAHDQRDGLSHMFSSLSQRAFRGEL